MNLTMATLEPPASTDRRLQQLYVVGGTQKDRSLEEWHQFRNGIVLELDETTRTRARATTHLTPAEWLPDAEPSHLFKAATVAGDRMYVCSQTEVLRYRLPQMTLERTVSLPAFNDLHHVWPTREGTLLVANTGLDMVMEITWAGRVVREWAVLGGDPWQRFSREVDYRRVATTKPHASHPNYVFESGGAVWVTRFKQKDAVCLTMDYPPIHFGRNPHDGVYRDGRLYFTSVDGFVFVVDAGSYRVIDTVDLNQIGDRECALGWCRSILPVDERRCWVGFTRFRPTAAREYVSWIRRGFRRHHRPTRIALYDLKRRELLEEMDLEPYGMNAVFSIHAWPGEAAQPDCMHGDSI